MGIKEILQALEEECRQAEADIKERASLEAKQILAEAEERAKRARETVYAREKDRIEREKQNIINNARMEAARIIADAKDRAIQKVVDRLAALILDNRNYREQVMRKALEDTFESASLAGDGFEIYANKDDVDLLKKLVKEYELNLPVKTANSMKMGFYIENREGTVTIRSDLDVFLKKVLREYMPFIAERLFVEHDQT